MSIKRGSEIYARVIKGILRVKDEENIEDHQIWPHRPTNDDISIFKNLLKKAMETAELLSLIFIDLTEA